MRLTTQISLLVARNVVNHLEMLLDSTPMQFRDIDTSNVILLVGSFQNGREHGLAIHAPGVRLGKDKYGTASYYIAENRNSDAIVVYLGCGSKISKRAISNSKNSVYFGYRDYAEAAEFIQNDIFSKLQAQSEPVNA